MQFEVIMSNLVKILNTQNDYVLTVKTTYLFILQNNTFCLFPVVFTLLSSLWSLAGRRSWNRRRARRERSRRCAPRRNASAAFPAGSSRALQTRRGASLLLRLSASTPLAHRHIHVYVYVYNEWIIPYNEIKTHYYRKYCSYCAGHWVCYRGTNLVWYFNNF